MQTRIIPIAKAILLASMVLAPGVAKADIYSWHFGSGLFPDQVDPTMVSVGGSRNLQPDGLYVESNQILMSYYEQSGANVIRPEQFDLQFRLRVPYDYSQIPAVRSGTMFNVNLGNDVGITFGIANDNVYFLNTPNTERLGTAFVDTDETFHDYRLKIATDTRSFSMYQDNVLILSGITPGYGNSTPSIWWGDGTQYASGLGIWQSFEHNAAAVPEPATLLGIGIGVGLLKLGSRRRPAL